MILTVVGLLALGLVVGLLGRLLVPGPNPMTLGMTIVVGIVGSLAGGLLGLAVVGPTGAVVLAVLGSAAVVWLTDRVKAPS